LTVFVKGIFLNKKYPGCIVYTPGPERTELGARQKVTKNPPAKKKATKSPFNQRKVLAEIFINERAFIFV